jgi:hypothetical protein
LLHSGMVITYAHPQSLPSPKRLSVEYQTEAL